MFFVGSIYHYPNRLAIEWITQQLAPALLQLESDIRVAIVGAADSDVAPNYRHGNIDFLGRANSDVVETLYKTSDLMICPIQNDYRVKFKALEALAYGTPLYASRQTLLGLPYLSEPLTLDLDRVADAALVISRLLGQPERLRELGRVQGAQQAVFIASQEKIWSRTLDIVPFQMGQARRVGV